MGQTRRWCWNDERYRERREDLVLMGTYDIKRVYGLPQTIRQRKQSPANMFMLTPRRRSLSGHPYQAIRSRLETRGQRAYFRYFVELHV